MLAKLSILTLAAALPAHADPITDFKNGTSVYLRTSLVSLNGEAPRTTGGVLLQKSAGSIDLTFKASDIGLPVPVTVRARGSVTRSGLVFTIDNSYSPRIDLGGGYQLSRITGQLNAFATWEPGAPTANLGNVKLRLLGTNSVTAYGSFGSQRVTISETDFVTGVIQPQIASFAPVTTKVCSDREDTAQAFTVRLAAPARTGGAPIEIQSANPGIRVPRFVIVRERDQAVTLQTRIARNFTGTVQLVAASAGVKQTIEVPVYSHENCAVRP